ncbi:GTPase [Aquiflexum sp.]|uniref:GTPase n=1 Tax=Aquiflexum sp. TaxID=1872584 RepID=UPI003592EC3C
MREDSYNIAILGKSGVGKSSFLNYLFDENISDVGVGSPVTKVGFHQFEKKVNGLNLRIFDSWGLELDKVEKWEKELLDELKQRSLDKHPSKWFHSIFYCVSATSARIESFDIKLINTFLKDNYKVVIIFTKSDSLSQNDFETFQKILNDNLIKQVASVKVCSEAKTLLNGRNIEKFGREEVLNEIINGFWNSIITRIPAKTILLMKKRTACWVIKEQQFLQKSWIYDRKPYSKNLEDSLNRLVDDLEKMDDFFIVLSEAINTYSDIIEGLRVPPNLPNQKYLKIFKENSSSFFEENYLNLKQIFSTTFTFHPILALLILIVYKYSTRGNLKENLNDLENKLNSEIEQLFPKLEEFIISLKKNHNQ